MAENDDKQTTECETKDQKKSSNVGDAAAVGGLFGVATGIVYNHLKEELTKKD